MRTVAFVSQKSGSGKSTIVSSLAVAAHEMSEKVCVIDMDPQGSLVNWARIRAAGDIEVLASGAARLPALLASLERRGVTLALLDTPGAEGAASTAAMQAAELNISSVPPQPVRFAGQRSNAHGARGDRGQVRVPAQPMPARPADRAGPGRRRGARRNGRTDLPVDPCPGRVPGRGAPRPGRDRAQSIGRRCPGDARPLAVHQPSSGASRRCAPRTEGGVSSGKPISAPCV